MNIFVGFAAQQIGSNGGGYLQNHGNPDHLEDIPGALNNGFAPLWFAQGFPGEQQGLLPIHMEAVDPMVDISSNNFDEKKESNKDDIDSEDRADERTKSGEKLVFCAGNQAYDQNKEHCYQRRCALYQQGLA